MRYPRRCLRVERLEERVAPANLALVPLWDGERVDPSGPLLNTFGGNPVQGIQATIAHTTTMVLAEDLQAQMRRTIHKSAAIDSPALG